MGKCRTILVAITMCIALAGCAPQESLFPIFIKSDQVIEDQLLGEWVVQSGTEMNPDEKSGHAIFQKGKDAFSYEFTVPDLDEHGEHLISTAKLVRLGSYLFLDLGSPEMGTERNPSWAYPAIEGHVFGRLELAKDKMRIDFLSDQWVSTQAKAGKLTLQNLTLEKYEGSLNLPNRIVLTANSEELRKFALAHAEDKEAFSEHFVLERKK